MTNLTMTTGALSHLTIALISLDDAVKARDFFREQPVGVDVAVTLKGEFEPGTNPMDIIPAAALAAEQLRDAAQDPELVLQALVQQNVKQVIGAMENLHAVATEDLLHVSGFYEAQEEARMRAGAKARLAEALRR